MDWYIWVLIILAITAIILTALYFVGKRMQKKVDSTQQLLDSNKQTLSILVIDKKKMKMQDANLPQMVADQVPWYLRFRKMPMVKAKVGPKIMTLMCDDKVFKEIPVKKLVKVDISGIYITAMKGVKK